MSQIQNYENKLLSRGYSSASFLPCPLCRGIADEHLRISYPTAVISPFQYADTNSPAGKSKQYHRFKVNVKSAIVAGDIYIFAAHLHYMLNPSAKIFAGTGSKQLAEQICKSYGMQPGKINIQKFSDGEIQPIFLESIRGDAVFLIQSTYAPSDNLMELLLMIDAARRASANRIVAVLPYYGYARQDRKDRPRVAIGSKLVANMLVAAGADRVITMDLHAPQIQGYFDIPVDHLDSSAVFIPYITQLKLENLTFAAPDVGATNRIREIASYFNAEMVICDKHRKRANEIASMVVIGDVVDRDIVIIDDICDTAGTLAKAAALLKEKGARSVRALVTHPVLSGNAYENIENSVLEELVVCDTIPVKEGSNKIKILSVAELFAVAIRNAFENKSINNLFIHSQRRDQ